MTHPEKFPKPSLTAAPQPASGEHQDKILSTLRIKVLLTVFMSLLLLGIMGMGLLLVSQIFDRLTPSIARDLKWKAQRGATELANTAELGLVVADPALIQEAFGDYRKDADVRALAAVDAEGRVVTAHGDVPGDVKALFAGPRRQIQEKAAYLYAWDQAEIEGGVVGRIVVVVSTERIEAGARLRRSILVTAAGGCVAALFVSLLFVNFYIGPLVRVTEAAFVRLETTTKEALEATRLKSEFLANMSHEIRTPMNGILGMLDLLVATQIPPKSMRFVEMARRSAQGLMGILNDVLDFSKMEASKLTLREQVFPLEPLIEEVTELYASQAQGKGVELFGDVHAALPRLMNADRDRLRQVLSNLVNNAVKFTDQGHIILSVSSSSCDDAEVSQRVRFEVRDTGMGISAQNQRTLFDAFSQVDGSFTRKHGGSGLGLAICKQLVELMGSALQVSSEPGQGSVFSFELQVRAPAADQLSVVSDLLDGMLPELKVLVAVENQEFSARLVRKLAEWAIAAESVTDGRAACAALLKRNARREPFDVLILDVPDAELTIVAETLSTLGSPCKAIRLVAGGRAFVSVHEESRFDVSLPKPVRSVDLHQALRRSGSSARLAAAPTGLTDNAQLEPFAECYRILVVEDNEVNREVASEILTQLGCAVSLAENGRLGVELLENAEFDLVLMDCQMPVMDGYTATAAIRAKGGRFATLPIVALTAHALAHEERRARDAGVDDYVTKPVSARTLRRIVKRYCQTEGLLGRAAEAPAALTSVVQPSVRPVSKKVIATFLKHVPKQVQSIVDAVHGRDAAALTAAAHKLKGGCLVVGVTKMAEICAKLEQGVPGQDALALELQAEFERTRARFEKDVA